MIIPDSIRIVRKEGLTDSEIEEATNTAALAFRDDVWTRAALGGEMQFAPRLWKSWIRATILCGTVFVAEVQGRIVGISLWHAPGQGANARQIMAEQGYSDLEKDLPSHVHAWYEATKKKRIEFVGKIPERMNDGQSWYLKMLAVHPDFQHRGIARSIIETVAREKSAQVQNDPSYMALVAVTRFTGKVYESVGFKTILETKIPSSIEADDEFPLIFMAREL